MSEAREPIVRGPVAPTCWECIACGCAVPIHELAYVGTDPDMAVCHWCVLVAEWRDE